MDKFTAMFGIIAWCTQNSPKKSRKLLLVQQDAKMTTQELNLDIDLFLFLC
jgi:hypothetical protein